MGALFYLMERGGVIGLPLLAFTIWMLVDCINSRREYYWYWIILGFWGIGALIYFFTFKWDGSYLNSLLFGWWHGRRAEAEIKARVRHLDNAACYEDLGDSYWRLNKIPEAEAAYRKALERAGAQLDVRAKFADFLTSQNRPEEAWPLIDEVLCRQRDYNTDEILRQAARCLALSGEEDRAEEFYREFLDKHSYFEAHLEYAEFLLKTGRIGRGRDQLDEVILDIKTSPPYVQRRNWREIWRARWLLFRTRGLPDRPEEDDEAGADEAAP